LESFVRHGLLAETFVDPQRDFWSACLTCLEKNCERRRTLLQPPMKTSKIEHWDERPMPEQF
jgi:hypothetical protein